MDLPESILFVRHAEAEHVLDLPSSLQLPDPRLTPTGMLQAIALRERLPLGNDDVMVVSPVRRCLETAIAWRDGATVPAFVHPAVGPCVFRVTAWSSTLPCDRHLTREVILKDFPDLALAPAPDVLWEQGINLLEDGAALVEANRLLAWCRTLTARRVCIVCHDGTIHFYRQLLTGRVVTRADFLGDAESIEVVLSEREPEEDGAIGG